MRLGHVTRKLLGVGLFAGALCVAGEAATQSPTITVFAYGANGKFVVKDGFQSGTDCSNAVFGDPIPGVVKACFAGPTGPVGFTQCAKEGGRCTFPGFRTVAYGAPQIGAQTWSGADGFERKVNVAGGIDCNNATSGDPSPGVPKICYVAPEGPIGFPFCSVEGSSCGCRPGAKVIYGANGKWVSKTCSSTGGTVRCDDATFGDPAPGVANACFTL